MKKFEFLKLRKLSKVPKCLWTIFQPFFVFFGGDSFCRAVYPREFLKPEAATGLTIFSVTMICTRQSSKHHPCCSPRINRDVQKFFQSAKSDIFKTKDLSGGAFIRENDIGVSPGIFGLNTEASGRLHARGLSEKHGGGTGQAQTEILARNSPMPQ